MRSAPKYRVLLVDDDDIFAMLFRESISEHKELSGQFSVDRVSDGDEAIAHLIDGADPSGEAGTKPDIILLDQRMPRMDGTAVLQKLRDHETTRSIPVCMLSTSSQARQVEACYAAGANFCITKPSNLEDLIEKVGALLHFFANVIEVPKPTLSKGKPDR